ncbi:MAG: hypothetical protein JO254_02530 [Pseudolabrys sp.]|nr:hypothetical protein [Pseudolabrys sp.]
MIDNLVRLGLAISAIVLISGSLYVFGGGATNAAFESRANGIHLAR